MMWVLFSEGGSQSTILAYHCCPQDTSIYFTHHTVLGKARD